jgi:beta-galactosidase
MKDDAYYYQAQFTKIPTARIVPNEWEYTKEGEKAVWCYTNGATAELFQDGTSLGKQAVKPFDKAGWNVTWRAGNLTVVSYDVAGKQYATDSVVTPGAPASLSLSWDWPNAADATIQADGQDVAMLTAMVMDKQGLVVHESSTAIKFEVAGGTLLGTGNGDPSDHTPEGRPPEGSDTRSAWDGRVRVIAQSLTTAGELTVTASAPGLVSATARIKTTKFTPKFTPI